MSKERFYELNFLFSPFVFESGKLNIINEPSSELVYEAESLSTRPRACLELGLSCCAAAKAFLEDDFVVNI